MSDHPPRTIKQNSSLHLYCSQMAEELNNGGIDFKKYLEVVERRLDVPWTMQLFKDYVWRPVMESQHDIESTTEMDTGNPSDVHRIVDKFMAEKFGVSRPWPDRFNRRQG